HRARMAAPLRSDWPTPAPDWSRPSHQKFTRKRKKSGAAAGLNDVERPGPCPSTSGHSAPVSGAAPSEKQIGKPRPTPAILTIHFPRRRNIGAIRTIPKRDSAIEISRRRAGRKVTTMLAAIVNFLRAWRRYNASLKELYQLGDRELADIGITRS